MSSLRYYGILTFICLCLYLPGIANLPLFDRDEPHFAQASRQMLNENNYWQVNFQYQPRHLKPPGIYWLQAAAVHLFSSADSTKTWPYRLPSFLGAWIAVLLTFELGKLLAPPKTAVLAAALLACSVLMQVEAHLAVTDAMLLTTMMIMLLGLAQIYVNCTINTDPPRIAPWLFWLGMGLGIFIKGITPLVGGLTILGLCIADRNKSWLKKLNWQWGLPLLIVSILAWLIPLNIASGQNFLWDMIKGDVIPKLAGGQQSHGMWPGYYILIFTLIFWPASLWAAPAAIWSWRNRYSPAIRFLWSWIIPTWLFYELVPTKMPEYVLPTFPAIALLIAIALQDGIKMSANIWGKVQFALWIMFSAILIIGFIILGGWGWASALMVLSAMIYLMYYYKNPLTSAGIGIFFAACSFIFLWQMILPNCSSLWMSERISQFISSLPSEQVNRTNPIIAIGYQEPSLVFELGKEKVLMRNIFDAISFSPQDRSPRILLLANDQLPCFEQLALDWNLSWRPLGIIKGFQYNRGRQSSVHFLLVSGATYEYAKPYQTGVLGSFIRNDRPLLFFCRSSRLDFFRSNRPAPSMAQQDFYPYQ